ncbi:MAG: hypothetical protein ACREBD_07255 [Blastocatellia bacterium]
MRRSINTLKFALALLFVVTLIPSSQTYGQSSKTGLGELYGGIEIGSKGIKATAIRVSDDENGYSVKLIYAEVINTTAPSLKDNKFSPETIQDTALAVQKLLTRMRQEYKVPLERIGVIGSSGLRADNPEDLIKAVKDKTGVTMSFLDVETEAQLSIAGAIPQRYRVKSGWADNRGQSVLLDIGSGNTKGGYQVIRQMGAGAPDYDYVTVGIPKGTVTFTNEINQATGETGDLAMFTQRAKTLSSTSIRTALRKEMERKPGLVNRQHVYLTGDIVWAMITLLYPADRRTFVSITAEDILFFHHKVTRNPESLQAMLNPDLTKKISNPKLRAEAEKEVESVRNALSPKNLIAGAEILKAVTTEFNLSGKRVRFARYGYLAWILSYVRLQAEQ